MDLIVEFVIKLTYHKEIDWMVGQKQRTGG